MDVKQMSVWEFNAAVEGWVEANSPPEEERLGDADRQELWEMVKENL